MWLGISCSCDYSSGLNLPQGGLELPCALHFSGDAKLGRSYKLNASKILILAEFNSKQASSTVNSSNFPSIWYRVVA